MRLTKVALLALRGLDVETRKSLAASFGISLPTINRWVANNDDNLTKAANCEAISKEIGLPVSEILEKESEVKEAQN